MKRNRLNVKRDLPLPRELPRNASPRLVSRPNNPVSRLVSQIAIFVSPSNRLPPGGNEFRFTKRFRETRKSFLYGTSRFILIVFRLKREAKERASRGLYSSRLRLDKAFAELANGEVAALAIHSSLHRLPSCWPFLPYARMGSNYPQALARPFLLPSV